ncbi:hypothetical protein ACFE33_04050 [Falsihalocynthiibacter sp. SS001]|uniref:hypothetical protein n=1 Tax=Falsihalocynthiibacter sp. SS001 TaxID=3349698 RepID=UPI0036D319A0
MSSLSPQECADDVAHHMKKKLSVGGAGLHKKLRRGGRLLPRYVRRDAETLIEAATLSEHPKLARIVDQSRVQRAHASCMRYLKKADNSDRRKGLWLGILGGVAWAFLIPAGAFITVLVWRGYL